MAYRPLENQSDKHPFKTFKSPINHFICFPTTNIYEDSAITILKFPSPKKLARAHINKISSLHHGRCKCSTEHLISAAKASAGYYEEYHVFQLLDTIEDLEHIQKCIEGYNVQIRKYVDELCPNILTIPGVGDILQSYCR